MKVPSIWNSNIINLGSLIPGKLTFFVNYLIVLYICICKKKKSLRLNLQSLIYTKLSHVYVHVN